jgi:hypothetical protein
VRLPASRNSACRQPSPSHFSVRSENMEAEVHSRTRIREEIDVGPCTVVVIHICRDHRYRAAGPLHGGIGLRAYQSDMVEPGLVLQHRVTIAIANVPVSDAPRYIIVGAGAMGGALGGVFARAGIPVILIARDSHAKALATGGIVLRTPDETCRVPVETASSPHDVRLPARRSRLRDQVPATRRRVTRVGRRPRPGRRPGGRHCE